MDPKACQFMRIASYVLAAVAVYALAVAAVGILTVGMPPSCLMLLDIYFTFALSYAVICFRHLFANDPMDPKARHQLLRIASYVLAVAAYGNAVRNLMFPTARFRLMPCLYVTFALSYAVIRFRRWLHPRRDRPLLLRHHLHQVIHDLGYTATVLGAFLVLFYAGHRVDDSEEAVGASFRIDDSKWDEVAIINGYAVFMGYLDDGRIGIPIKLESFVSTSWVFNFRLKEKLSDMVRSWWGLLYTVFATVNNEEREFKGRNKVKRTFILAGIQGLALGIILCPLGVLCLLGLYISAGVSLWRLMEHDYGDDRGANLKPALQVLYTLAVAQGVLFGYKAMYGNVSRIRLAKLVAEDGTVDEELVVQYLEETLSGCEKDPSFTSGRNLVTYGVDLMTEPMSNEGFISGIRVLGGVIKNYSGMERGRKVLAKHLLARSDSSGRMIERLLETVGSKSPYSREVREHAARIVALVARGIRLESFPGVIECISSVLEESNQLDSRFDWARREYGDNKLKHYERVEMLERYELEYLIYDCESPDSPDFSLRSLIQWLVQCLLRKRKPMENKRKERRTVHGFDGLLTEALNIIHQLAVDEDNRRRIMSNTVLQHKIAMAPLKLHRDNHDACSVFHRSELQLLEKCWVLMEWLVKETNSGALM
ncbi:hypothetical protein BAE44_0002688 [Dichanthelium oligosanthes]|uniref:DUF4220 domain-containing protein n=1 Tax=Dichanthelium oligosanthes TaxID=888268 RepID=A0A1E5WFX0_9POAL|nr:hypothetical protein BAE44_0002688 [Dichanthelium oligosanthes]